MCVHISPLQSVCVCVYVCMHIRTYIRTCVYVCECMCGNFLTALSILLLSYWSLFGYVVLVDRRTHHCLLRGSVVCTGVGGVGRCTYVAGVCGVRK